MRSIAPTRRVRSSANASRNRPSGGSARFRELDAASRHAMRQIKASGILITRGQPIESFLLMRHKNRWDLPKGHLDEGETEMQCALRELREETGIQTADIELDPVFRFATEYDVDSQRFGERCHKTVVIFLARLVRGVAIAVTEHVGYQWFKWRPPHRIQEQTIDPLLAAAERHVARVA